MMSARHPNSSRSTYAGFLWLALALVGLPAALSAQSAVAGTVTDAAGAPLAAVTVSVEGTTLGTISRDDGTYRIGGVPAGARVLMARRVGYTPERRSVTVGATELAVNFQLTAAATSLEGVTTTATGQQRKIELGNTIASIDAAAMKETQAISTLSDMLNAQATGVVVLAGTVPGTASRIRIRGQNSLSVSNDPIFIIDGVRMTSAVSPLETGSFGLGAGTSRPSRLEDLNPEEIENIEIVKGPSAATLYGTDAANGVIVITTKRGKAGPARWSFHAERGTIRDDSEYKQNHAIIGFTNTRLQSLTRCRLSQLYHFDTLAMALQPLCTFVSHEVVDLARGDSTTWLIPAPRTVLGGQVSGGTNELRYFVSGDRSKEYGPYGLPLVDRHRFDSLSVPIRPEMERPSMRGGYAFRSNINAAMTPKVDVQLGAGLTLNESRFPLTGNAAGPVQQLQFASGCIVCFGNISSVGGWGSTPGNSMRSLTEQTTNRIITSLTANFRPLSWLNASTDLGVDLADERSFSLDRAGENNNLGGTSGSGIAIDQRTRYVSYTSNIRGTASWQLRDWAQLRSTGGWQFVATNNSTVQAKGTGLGVGGETPGQGVNKFITNSNRPVRTMGMYLEEQLALRDRLYLTAAVRTDQASAFGTDFQNTYYPKFGLSWIVSDEPFLPTVPFMNQLRLRFSYGTSGVQPGLTEAITTYSAGSGFFMGSTGNSLALATTGNPNLKPERSNEIETGFDSRWWDERVNLEFTYYRKETSDALFSQPTAASAGVPAFRTNLGGMLNQGVEYRVNAQLLDTRNYGFDLTFSGSNNQNKILDLGPVLLTDQFSPNQPGRPVGSVYKRKLTYRDWNGDGYLGSQEVKLWGLDSTLYLGPDLDPVQMTLASGAEFLGRRLRVQAMFDRKDGAFARNTNQGSGCSSFFVFPGCQSTNDPGASLAEQARGVGFFVYSNSDGYTESTAFTRLREVSLSYNMPESFANKYLRAKNARISAAGRNLWYWADEWTNGDPEQTNGQGLDNANKLWSYGPPSYYMLRLNITY